MEKIIIDTDIGVDDAFAVAYGAKYCDLLGITTVAGNIGVDQATKNAKFFTKLMGIDCPVCRGLSRPLVKEQTPPATHVHGNDGLGDAYDNPCDSNAPDAISFIIDTVMSHPHEVILAPIGPLTNIAIALNKEPRLAENIKRIVLMGGAFGTKGHAGNATPLAEFNIWKDPHAADQVFTSKVDVVVVPLDVTHQVNLTADEVASTHNEPLIKISQFYLNFNQQVEGFAGMCVHDALTIDYILHPESYTAKKAATRVVCGGISDGQTVMRTTKLGVDPNPFGQEIKEQTVLLDVNVANVKADLLSALSL